MSSLIVEVCCIDRVEPHTNADALEISHVKGWRVVTKKGQFVEGDKCVYLPPDCVLSRKLSDHFGITPYLGTVRDSEGLRVKVAKLRGEPSYGVALECEDPSWEVGQDLVDHYGITKWEPPLESTDGDAAAPHPAFHKYTDIENIRNFPNLFEEGEEVVVTEKIHGKNARLGYIKTLSPGAFKVDYQFMAGSHNNNRKEFDAKGKKSQFWEILTDNIKRCLEDVSLKGEHVLNPFIMMDCPRYHNVVLFGEVYGSAVQDMTYGFKNGEFGFRAFDIALDGKYLSFETKTTIFQFYGIPSVPTLYRGPFSLAKMEELAAGPTTLCGQEEAGKFKGREGVVISPIEERFVTTPTNLNARLILKCINFDYLTRKSGTEFH